MNLQERQAARAASDAIAMWTGALVSLVARHGRHSAFTTRWQGKDEQGLRLLRRIEGFYWALLQRDPSPEALAALSTLESLSGGLAAQKERDIRP